MLKKNKFNGSINKPFVPERKQDDKKSRYVAIVLLFILAFCCFGSVLAIGLTVKDCFTASAEEVVSEEVPVPEGYPNLFSGNFNSSNVKELSTCTYTNINSFSLLTFAGSEYYVCKFTLSPVHLSSTFYTLYSSYSSSVSLVGFECGIFADFYAYWGSGLSTRSLISISNPDPSHFSLAFKKIDSNAVFPENFTCTFSVGLWQGDFSNSDFASSVYYQAGLLQGQTDGYKIGFNEGYSKGGDDYAKSLSSSASSIFSNADIKYVADLYDSEGHTEWSTTIIPTIDNQSIMFDRFTIPTDKVSLIDDDKVVVTFNGGLLFNPTDFSFQGFPSDMTVNFVFTYKNGHKFKNIYSVSSLGLLVSYFGGGTDLTTNQAQVFDYSSVVSIDSMTMTFTHLRMFKDYADVLVLSVAQGYGLGFAKGVEEQKKLDYNSWYMGRYNQGYSDGVKSAGDYTFLSLLGAVVDAPLQAVSGMLNFNLLGFNMLNFFYALLTCALVIAVIRLIL